MPRQPKKVVTITQVKDQPCDNQRQALSQLRRIKWGIEFRNENQKIFWETIDKSDVTFCAGPAGCGKTYVATYWALQNLVCQFELKDVVRHKIVAGIIDRYEHDFYLGDVSAEETISRYVKKYIMGKSNEVWTNIQ